MLRVLAILLIAILLLPAPQAEKPRLMAPGALIVRAYPLPLDSKNPGRRTLGPLIFLNAWRLESDNPAFGGISSMLASEDGGLIALSDSGLLFGFAPEGHAKARPFIAPLPIRPHEKHWPVSRWDSESMFHDPESDKYWVGFELIQRVCRYSTGFARIESCASPKALKKWPETGSVEAMVRLRDGRVMLFGEFALRQDGYNEVLLFSGDPAEPRTRPPVSMAYQPPKNFYPTDAVMLDDRRLLVLNRRARLYDGFTATLALVELPEKLGKDVLLKGQEIARFAPPILSDNFEALAISRERGRQVVWIASDDNHLFFQRNLLLKFALPDDF